MTEYELIGLRDDDHLLNKVRLLPRLGLPRNPFTSTYLTPAGIHFLRHVKEPELRAQNALVKKGRAQAEAVAEAESHAFAVSYDEFNQLFMFFCVVGPAPKFVGFKDIPSLPLLLSTRSSTMIFSCRKLKYLKLCISSS